jgi:PAS domain S-box-containing protein
MDERMDAISRALPELQETLLGQALAHARVAAIVLDEEGRFLAANEQASVMTGYPREELLELGSRGLAVDGMARGALTRGSGPIRCRDGTIKRVAYRIESTRVSGLPYYVGVFWEDEG